jgi:hypothetical protein
VLPIVYEVNLMGEGSPSPHKRILELARFLLMVASLENDCIRIFLSPRILSVFGCTRSPRRLAHKGYACSILSLFLLLSQRSAEKNRQK